MVEPKPTNQNARPMPWRCIWLTTIPNNRTQQCRVVRRDRKEKITRPSCFAVFFFSVDNESFLKYLSPTSRARFGGRWSRSGNFSLLEESIVCVNPSSWIQNSFLPAQPRTPNWTERAPSPKRYRTITQSSCCLRERLYKQTHFAAQRRSRRHSQCQFQLYVGESASLEDAEMSWAHMCTIDISFITISLSSKASDDIESYGPLGKKSWKNW